MTKKVAEALARLSTILPLKQRLQDCSIPIKKLHRQILNSFVARGRILTRKEMAAHVSNLEEAVTALEDSDLVVFSPHGDPVGAYPFTMEEREHKVLVNGHRVHAMCALDALAVSPMFGISTQISSRCRISGTPVTLEQSGLAIKNRDAVEDIHFGIHWGAANGNSCCADSLCMEMMFLRDGDIAGQWLAEEPDSREIFTLPEAVEFSARFFVPIMS